MTYSTMLTTPLIATLLWPVALQPCNARFRDIITSVFKQIRDVAPYEQNEAQAAELQSRGLKRRLQAVGIG